MFLIENEINIFDKRFITSLTALSTFLMGFIDSYTFMEHDGLFASAQTGNIIVLVARMVEGEWIKAFVHIFTFLGFAFGAFVGQALIDKLKEKEGWPKYRIFLTSQVVLLLIISITQGLINDSSIGFLLGFLAGCELTIFRDFGTISINNGIMTGNAKKLMNNFYKMLFNKNSKAKDEFLSLTLGIGIFMTGVGIGSLIIRLGFNYNLWISFIITFLFLIWLEIRNSMVKAKLHKEKRRLIN